MAKKRSKKPLIITLVLIVIIIAVIIAVTMNTKDSAIKVTTSKVEKKTITQTVSAIGKIVPETEVKISSETSGEIIFLGVNEGDTVKAGTILVRIKPDIVETQLEQYQAAMDAAKLEIQSRKTEMERTKAELNRMKELFQKKFISEAEFDIAQASYDQSVSAYESAQARYRQSLATYNQFERNFARTTIKSPVNGIITSLSVEEGEKVVGTAQMAGTEMMRVSDLSVMNAEVEVDENDIVLVSVGDTATVEIDALPDKIYKGKVIEIGHSALVSALGSQDQVTNFKVKIRLLDEEPKLRPGMSCNTEIATDTRYNVLSIPLQAVTIREHTFDRSPDVQSETGMLRKEEDDSKSIKKKKPQSVVFIKDGNKAKLTEVETGISDEGIIEITKGLKDGETIISGSYQAVSKLLQDGSIIEVDSTYKKYQFNKK
jgi:HlyD family secretion protein